MLIEPSTPRLVMRQWRESDRERFADLNADPAVMEFFPSVISRANSDGGIDRWQAQLDVNGWGNWAVERRDTGEFIGYVGITEPIRTFAFSPCIEVGWRLARRHWGHGFASEAANESLNVGFEQLALAEIVSMTALANRRSRAVMERIGMRNADQDFEHPGVPEGNALRVHCLYRITSSCRSGP